ncbi:TBC1 domain family member 15 [Morus notabilis]|uniref:TBC1 domain family member 15 n=1 Tax=Morus notabilis TaxID=981085 RepID=W9R0G2_9ROSA|nr:TBC1 domain family member 15 [Morus notabilis]
MAALFMKKASTAELETFYPIRPECQKDVPKTRFKLRAGKTLSARRWKAAFSQDGRLDIASVLRRVQRGGVHPSIKGVVWEFLLGCYDPNSTFEERNILRQRRSTCMTEVMEFGTVGLDVVRTDRVLVFYESEANQAKLWDVLSVYAWLDNDIGYVQGMNDICSPMVILLDDEADAFWCFERAMRRLMSEFKAPTAYASAPLNSNGEARDGPNSARWVSGDTSRRSGRVPNSPVRDLPDLPKASRRLQSTDGANSGIESPTREKVEKTRQRRSSKNASRDPTDSPRQGRRSMDSNSGVESPSRNLPDVPKKSQRKKSKDGGGSSRSRSKAQASPADQLMETFSDPGSNPGDQLMAPFSDPGSNPESAESKGNDLNCQKPPILDEAKEIKGLIR